MTSTRTVEDVDKVIVHAKLEVSDLLPVSQIVNFSTELLDQTKVKFMEVDAKLAETLAVGDTLTFRGDGEDNAVLCTDHSTYDIKEAETSNR